MPTAEAGLRRLQAGHGGYAEEIQREPAYSCEPGARGGCWSRGAPALWGKAGSGEGGTAYRWEGGKERWRLGEQYGWRFLEEEERVCIKDVRDGRVHARCLGC